MAMSSESDSRVTGRSFLTLSTALTAGYLVRFPDAAHAESPPEIDRIRLVKNPPSA